MVTPHRRRRLVPALSLLGALLTGACQDPPTTGDLIVNVTGLPQGANAAIRITGPNQFFQRVNETISLENLLPGDYILRSDTIVFQETRYGAAAVEDTVTVVRGQTQSSDISYGVASGAVSLTIAGLPTGASASVILRGPLTPAGSPTFNEGIFESRTVRGLRPGSYEIVADTTFTVLGDKFASLKRLDTIAVPASLSPVSRSVQYNMVSGTLALTVTGLPVSFSRQPVTVTGPGDYIRTTSQSMTLRGLDAGTYSIVAENLTNICPDRYLTQNSQQSVNVVIGETATASVAYTAEQVNPGALNLGIAKAYLTQATQSPDGGVPLLSGKPALLRVFGSANQCNSAKPQVRVTVGGSAPVALNAGEDSVRTVVDDQVPASSWNYLIPANIVQPGLSVLAEIDPANQVAEANEGDNTRTITPDIQPGPVVALRFVPIHQSAVNLTGNVHGGNAEAFLEWPRKLYPVATFDFDIREPYTTSRTLDPCNNVGTTGSCPSWSGVVAELRAIRNADQSNRYYYGVVRLPYTSGVLGIASGIGTFESMGWDVVNFGFGLSAPEIMAHEMGHNFGRRHAPCGGALGTDPAYPYPGGRIGVLGWHPVEGFKHTGFGDIMGYCDPQWISDYTYVGVWNWLQSNPGSASVVAVAESASLLVWGTITNGQISLEPAFEISSATGLPAPGPHRIALLDERGGEITSLLFSAQRIVDVPGDAETFAFTIPLSSLRGRSVSSLRATANGRTVTAVPSGDVGADPRAVVTRAGARAARIQWDATRFPVVMVRDAASGHILSFARGGDATIATNRSELDLNFSNRVRSTRRLKAVQ